MEIQNYKTQKVMRFKFLNREVSIALDKINLRNLYCFFMMSRFILLCASILILPCCHILGYNTIFICVVAIDIEFIFEVLCRYLFIVEIKEV